MPNTHHSTENLNDISLRYGIGIEDRNNLALSLSALHIDGHESKQSTRVLVIVQKSQLTSHF